MSLGCQKHCTNNTQDFKELKKDDIDNVSCVDNASLMSSIIWDAAVKEGPCVSVIWVVIRFFWRMNIYMQEAADGIDIAT